MYVLNGLYRQDAVRWCDLSVAKVVIRKLIRVPIIGSVCRMIPIVNLLAGRKANLWMSAKRLEQPSRAAFLCANTQKIQQS